jgi:hypothetical protein
MIHHDHACGNRRQDPHRAPILRAAATKRQAETIATLNIEERPNPAADNLAELPLALPGLDLG